MVNQDANIHPVATGLAAKLVEARQAPQDLEFYSGWFCPFNQRVWITLEAKGIPYQLKEVNPFKKEADFLKLNPKGLVPTVGYKGTPLYESLILLEFLDELHPKNPIFPNDPVEKARVRIVIDHIAKKILPSFHSLIQNQDPKEQEKFRKQLTSALKEFSSLAKLGSKGGAFSGGKDLDAADIALAPWAEREFIYEDHRGGKLTEEEVGKEYLEWSKAIKENEWVKKTTSEREHYLPIYQRYLKDEAMTEAAKATRAGGVLP